MGRLAQILPATTVDPADFRVMRRVGGAMFIGGAISSLAGVITVQATAEGRESQTILATILFVLGCLLLALPPRVATFRLGVLAGVGVISAMIATAQPISATEFFYLWPVVFAAYFLGARFTLVVLALLTVTLGAALIITTDDVIKSDIFTSTVTSVGLIGALIGVMRTREERLAERLEEAARTDALTGLLNRHGLEPELRRLADQTHRTGVPLAIALFDLDHFKWFNDAHGHLEGDQALRRTGAMLRECARIGDCVVRFGGEEFAVLLPGATAEGAHSYVDRVAATFAAEDIVEDLRLTASCGIAHLSAGETIDAVFIRADEALYAAKNNGRNRAAWWSEDGAIIVGQPLETIARRLRSVAPQHPREYVVRLADRPGHVDPERRTA